MPRRKLPLEPDPLSLWLVRKIRRHDGELLAKPTLWGKVPAVDAHAAVIKFISITKSASNPKHFDAIPFTDGGTRG